MRGVIKKKLTAATKLKGYTVRASEEEPQYVIESDKTDHVAVPKGPALRKLRSPARRRGIEPHPSQPMGAICRPYSRNASCSRTRRTASGSG